MNADLFRTPVDQLRAFKGPEFQAELAKIKGEQSPAATEAWPFSKGTRVRNKRSGATGIVQQCERRTGHAGIVWVVTVETPNERCVPRLFGVPVKAFGKSINDWLATNCERVEEFPPVHEWPPATEQALAVLLTSAADEADAERVRPLEIALALIAQAETNVFIFGKFEIVRDRKNGGWIIAGRPDLGGYADPLSAALMLSKIGDVEPCST